MATCVGIYSMTIITFVCGCCRGGVANCAVRVLGNRVDGMTKRNIGPVVYGLPAQDKKLIDRSGGKG